MEAEAGVGGSGGSDGDGGTSPDIDCALAKEFPVVASCSEISDEIVRAFVHCDQDESRVPDGYYAESPAFREWEEPCSADAQTTRDRAETWATTYPAGNYRGFRVLDESETDYFYEVRVQFREVIPTAASVRVYRNTKCAYFDGDTLAGAPHDSADPLAFLASYLRYGPMRVRLAGQEGGSFLLAVVKRNVGEGFEVDLCYTRAFCESISLVRATFSEDADGRVTVGEPVEVRSLETDCVDL